MFVARVGEKALTAISLVYPLQTLVTSISVGFWGSEQCSSRIFFWDGRTKKSGSERL